MYTGFLPDNGEMNRTCSKGNRCTNLCVRQGCRQFLELSNLRKPDACTGIRGHVQIAPGGDCNTSHLGTVRQAGTLELLGEKPLVKNL